MKKEQIKKVDDPLKFLDNVCNIGKIKKDVKFDDLTLTLQTLTAEDEVEIFQNCNGFNGVAYLTKSKIETLTYAIKAINGNGFDYDDVEDEEQRIEAKIHVTERLRKIISKWHDELLSFIYNHYLEIAAQSEELLKKKGIISVKEIEDKLEDEVNK